MPLFVLLSWSCCCVLFIQPCPAEGSNCTCTMSNSRCDETGVCRCDPGWEGDQCEVCVRMPGCVHGSCHQPWQCTCEPGWTGRFCDKDIHVCSRERPCLSGSTCVTDDTGEYSCLCPHGYHGNHCQLKTGPCHQRRSPCKNGGQCEDDEGFAAELRCRCLAGFTGARCETDMDDCLMRPCANGATCLDGVNRFSCLCPRGFTGRFCTVNLDDCASAPCLHGGRCLDRAGTFQCLCRPGYTGRTCQEEAWKGQTPHKSHPSDEGQGRGGHAGVTLGQRDHWSNTRNSTHSSSSSSSSSISSTHSASGGSSNGDRLLKISVKEVVTQGGSSGVSQVQLATMLVLGGMTLAVVLLTAGLVFRGLWCRGGHGASSSSSRQQEQQQQQQQQQSETICAEQEYKICFLHAASGQEVEKKRLNTEVI